MNSHDVLEVLAKPLSLQLLASNIPARFAYTGLDGDPRVIPIGFLWTGEQVKLYTVPTSAQVKALEAHPRVAITIDTQAFPPNVLLVRGQATLELVDGVPDGYVEASRRLVARPLPADGRRHGEPRLGKAARLRDHPPEGGRGPHRGARPPPLRAVGLRDPRRGRG